MAYYRIDDIRTEESGLTYVEVSIWSNRGAFQRGDAADEIQDFRMQLPAVGAVRPAKRKRGNNYVKADDTEWTEAEYQKAVRDYHQGLRENPKAELAVEDVPFDHAAHIERKIAEYLDRKKARGTGWRGDDRDKAIRTRAARVGEVAELAAVKAIKGAERERP